MQRLRAHRIFILAAAVFGAVILSRYSHQPMVSHAEEIPEVTVLPENPSVMDGVGPYEVLTFAPVYFESVSGYYAAPKDMQSFPGIIMIHEMWGLNSSTKELARKMASNGYQVLAVDLYEGQTATDEEEALQLSSAVTRSRALENMKAGVLFLKQQGTIKVASIGWSYGSYQSVQLGLSGELLDASVLYYGLPVVDGDSYPELSWPILGFFGADDRSTPPDHVERFNGILDQMGIENQIYVYPGVGQAFADPGGDMYALDEARDAWSKTLSFLDKHLKDS